MDTKLQQHSSFIFRGDLSFTVYFYEDMQIRAGKQSVSRSTAWILIDCLKTQSALHITIKNLHLRKNLVVNYSDRASSWTENAESQAAPEAFEFVSG